MHQEIDLIVQAIESLKQEPDFIKDYLFPISSALFTSILGAGIAYFTVTHQEKINTEREKIGIANKWTLLAEEARATLIAIKQNYNDDLTYDPLHRISVVPNILFHSKSIQERYEELAFIVTKSKDGDKIYEWAQIPRIRCMISNYNYVLELWQQRNQLDEPIKEKIFSGNTHTGYVSLSHEHLIELIGAADIAVYIDVTERAIKFTDDLIIEFDDFLMKFPVYAKSLIEKDVIKRFGPVLKYSNNDNHELLNLIKRSVEPDLSLVEDIFGYSAEKLKKRYITGYEKKL